MGVILNEMKLTLFLVKIIYAVRVL